MTHEETILKEYVPIILQRVLIFRGKTRLPAHYHDDMYQEGCIAFIAFLRNRGITGPRLTKEEVMDVSRFIDLHFLTAFQDTDGIGLNRNTRKKYYAEGGHGLDSTDRLGVAVDGGRTLSETEHLSEDEFFSVYVRDWISVLGKDERRTVRELMRGYNVSEIAKRLKIPRQRLRTSVRRMRGSFREYVEGCLSLNAG